MAGRGPITRWFDRWRSGGAHADEGSGPVSEFWVDLGSGAIEEGRQSPGVRRMGPYPTREAAQAAFDTAAARNEAWDEEDWRWRDEQQDE